MDKGRPKKPIRTRQLARGVPGESRTGKRPAAIGKAHKPDAKTPALAFEGLAQTLARLIRGKPVMGMLVARIRKIQAEAASREPPTR